MVLRVAVDGQTFASPDADRGIGTYVRHVLRAMTVHTSARTTLLAYDKLPASVADLEIAATMLRKPQRSGPAAQAAYHLLNAQIRAAVERAGCDVLYNPNALQLNVEAVARAGAVPLVSKVFDLTPFHLNLPHLAQGSRDGEIMYLRRLAHVAEHSDRVLTCSESTRADILRFMGVDAKRVDVVLYGVTGQFHRKPTAGTTRRVLAELGITQEIGQAILVVGGYHPKKNHEGLFRSMALLPEVFRAAHPIVFAGSLNETDRHILRQMRDNICRDARLIFAGHVTDEQLAVLYHSARALAFPSLHEGFGFPVAEAIVCGCPVVTSNVSSVPEVAGDAAILVPPNNTEALADGLQRVVACDTTRATLQEAMAARAPYFDWSRAARETVRCFESAAAAGRVFACGSSNETESNVSVGDSRATLLWYSPLPPMPGGVTAYSLDLVRRLRNHADVRFVQVSPDVTLPDDLADLPLISPAEATATTGPDVLCVYNMGNNESQCGVTYDALMTRPGLTILHDLNIHGFLLEHLVRKPGHIGQIARLAAESHPYLTALKEAHGEFGASEARRVLTVGMLPDIQQYPCHPTVTRRSLGIVAHSRWASRELAWPALGVPSYFLPLGVEYPLEADEAAVQAVRTRLGLTPEDFLVVSAGFIEHNRRPDVGLDALHALEREGRRMHYLLAGRVNPEVEKFLREAAGRIGLSDRVHLNGYVESDADFVAILAAADAVLHLRQPTNGETSATVLRALACGRAVLVNDIDSYAELPDDCCWKVPIGRHQLTVLVAYLRNLHDDAAVRSAMGRAGQAHIEKHHTWDVVAGRFLTILEQTLRASRGNAIRSVATD